jgi:hypothetical protein
MIIVPAPILLRRLRRLRFSSSPLAPFAFSPAPLASLAFEIHTILAA